MENEESCLVRLGSVERYGGSFSSPSKNDLLARKIDATQNEAGWRVAIDWELREGEQEQ